MKPVFTLVLAGVLSTAVTLNASMFDTAMEQAASATKSTSEKSSGLLDTLTKTLGVTETQAAGGTAALLNEAKSNMSSDSFSSLLSMVPDLSSLTGGASSLLGGSSGSSLTDQFSALGMDSDMISQFTTVILDYVKGEGGSEAMDLLKGALL